VWVIFFIVQVVGVGSAPGFLKKNCHVFSKKIAKSVVHIDTRFLKIQKFPNSFVPKKKRKKTLLSTQLKKLQKLKNSFSKSLFEEIQSTNRGTRENFPPLYKSEPVLN
jgi:hypothetical protein